MQDEQEFELQYCSMNYSTIATIQVAFMNTVIAAWLQISMLLLRNLSK